MADGHQRRAGSYRVLMCIVVGCILTSCLAGVAGAAAGQDLYFSTTTPTPTPAFVTCGSGCQCLFEFEIPTVFGERGRNYVKCSEIPCGQGTVVEVRQYKYCFRPQPSPPAQQPPVQQPLAPAPGASTGSLSISSQPSGASVTLDGQYRGNTPVTIQYLSPGYHDLRLSLSGYQDSTQSPPVSAGSVTALSVPLVPSGQGVSQGSTGDQVSVVSLDDQVSVVSLADDRDKLNPQPEPPSPADRIKLNPQPEPPKPSSVGFFDSIISSFSGLFGGNIQNTQPSAAPVPTEPTAVPTIPPGCKAPGWMICNGQCVDTQNDFNNCNGCGITCPGNKVCTRGQCANTCLDGRVNCFRYCTDILNDADNCGGCKRKCPTGQSCVNWQCKCNSPNIWCNGVCTDTFTNVDNCGACGTKCDAGQTCTDGKCSLPTFANVDIIEKKPFILNKATATHLPLIENICHRCHK